MKYEMIWIKYKKKIFDLEYDLKKMFRLDEEKNCGIKTSKINKYFSFVKDLDLLPEYKN